MFLFMSKEPRGPPPIPNAAVLVVLKIGFKFPVTYAAILLLARK